MEGILTAGVKEWLIWTVQAMVSAALMDVSMFARLRDRQTDRHTEGQNRLVKESHTEAAARNSGEGMVSEQNTGSFLEGGAAEGVEVEGGRRIENPIGKRNGSIKQCLHI